MDIKVTSTGRIFYQVDSTVAAILCEMFPEAVQRVAAPAQVAAAARWTNTTTSDLRKYILVVCNKCNREDRFDGTPAQLAAFEASLCSHAGHCPESVLGFYGDGGNVLLGRKFQ